ncbi:MAG: hypothetical protein KGJ66_15620 [Alphaproteobacteria bacterium]|nr:hypothetical protein [Alphaproteobacteria bacterium]
MRAILLLVAFGLSLAGQALAATVVVDQSAAARATPMMMVTGADGMARCPGCDRANNTGMVPNCAVGICWGLVAVPAQAVRVERLKSVVFALLPDTFSHGIAVRPEPHPPRSLTSI